MVWLEVYVFCHRLDFGIIYMFSVLICGYQICICAIQITFSLQICVCATQITFFLFQICVCATQVAFCISGRGVQTILIWLQSRLDSHSDCSNTFTFSRFFPLSKCFLLKSYLFLHQICLAQFRLAFKSCIICQKIIFANMHFSNYIRSVRSDIFGSLIS